MPPTEPASPRLREHPWALGLAVGALVFAPGMGLQALGWEHRSLRSLNVNVAVLGALVLLVACAPLVQLVSHKLMGRRGPVIAWLSVAVGTVALAASVTLDLGYTLDSTWRFFTPYARLFDAEPWACGISVVTLLAAWVIAWRPLPSRRSLRALALAALCVSAPLIVSAAWRATRGTAPQDYLQSRREVGRTGGMHTDLPGNPSSVVETSLRQSTRVFGDLVLRTYYFGGSSICGALLGRPGSPPPEQVARRGTPNVSCEGLVLREDRPIGVYLLGSPGGSYPQPVVFDRATLAPWPSESTTMSRFARSMSLPHEWITTSALAWLLGLLALVLPSAAARRLAGSDRWREATLRPDNTLVFEHGVTAPAPYGTLLAPGPVVVFDSAPEGTSATPFRDAPSTVAPERDAVVRGPIPEALADLEASLDARAAWGLALAGVSLAAMTAGALHQLVL